MKCEGGLRMGRGEGPDGVSLKQEWQTDYILRADLDLLLLAAWRCGQRLSRLQPEKKKKKRLQPDSVQKDCCD